MTKLSDLRQHCEEAGLEFTRSTKSKRPRSNGRFVLVKSEEGKEIGFWQIAPDTDYLEEIEAAVNKHLGVNGSNGIDGVKDFAGWVEQTAKELSQISVDQALEATKCLDIRELFAKASKLGYDGLVKDGKISFRQASPPPKLPDVDFNEEELV